MNVKYRHKHSKRCGKNPWHVLTGPGISAKPGTKFDASGDSLRGGEIEPSTWASFQVEALSTICSVVRLYVGQYIIWRRSHGRHQLKWTSSLGGGVCWRGLIPLFACPHADPRALFVRPFRACWRYLRMNTFCQAAGAKGKEYSPAIPCSTSCSQTG